MHRKITDYGFEYGAAKVDRLACDEKLGWVMIGVKTPRMAFDVYVTKTGKICVIDPLGEWKRVAKSSPNTGER